MNMSTDYKPIYTPIYTQADLDKALRQREQEVRAETWRRVLRIADQCTAAGNFGWTLREQLRSAAIRRDDTPGEQQS